MNICLYVVVLASSYTKSYIVFNRFWKFSPPGIHISQIIRHRYIGIHKFGYENSFFFLTFVSFQLFIFIFYFALFNFQLLIKTCFFFKKKFFFAKENKTGLRKAKPCKLKYEWKNIIVDSW